MIDEQCRAVGITEPKKLEEQAISLVGTDIYEKSCLLFLQDTDPVFIYIKTDETKERSTMVEKIRKILALPRSLYWNIKLFGAGGYGFLF